jgi:hypothetical protein
MYTRLFNALSVAVCGLWYYDHEWPRGLHAATSVMSATKRYERPSLRPLRTLKTSTAISCSVVTDVTDRRVFLEVCKLLLFRELVLIERYSVSPYFGRLLEMNTVEVPDILLLRVLRGILLNFSAAFLRVMFLLACTCLLFYDLTRLFHVPIRHMKEVVKADGLWWTGWSCSVYKCIVSTILRHGHVNLKRVGLLFVGCNSVQSGSLLPAFWKHEVHSKRVNQLLSKLSNNLTHYTTCDKTVSVIASAVRTKKATSVCVYTQSLVCFLTDLGKYSRLDTGTLVWNMTQYH